MERQDYESSFYVCGVKVGGCDGVIQHMRTDLEILRTHKQEIAPKIIRSIHMDVSHWESVHGKRPGRIFVTPELYLMLMEYGHGLNSKHEEKYLFGIPLSEYYPSDKRRVAYYFSEKERLIMIRNEDV